jgi:hypothetical protein
MNDIELINSTCLLNGLSVYSFDFAAGQGPFLFFLRLRATILVGGHLGDEHFDCAFQLVDACLHPPQFATPELPRVVDFRQDVWRKRRGHAPDIYSILLSYTASLTSVGEQEVQLFIHA